MQSLDAIWKLSCIKGMGSYKERFISIANHYAPFLDQGNRLNDTLYTLHDFSHHCINIYKTISNVLLSDYAFTEYGLTDEEFYILNISVLFHDISLARILHFDRNLHSEQSALYFMDEFRNPSSLISHHITRQQMNAIILIIKAHSDIKRNGQIEKTIQDPLLTNDMPGSLSTIRAMLLAGILRLADELDVTNARIGTDTYHFTQLDGKNDSEAISREHWLSLMCFNDIRVSKDNLSKIELIIDDLYVEQEKDSILEIRKRIYRVINKASKECKYIMDKIVLTTPIAPILVVVRDIKICTNSPHIEPVVKRIDDQSQNELSNKTENEDDIFVNLPLSEDIESLKNRKLILVITALEKELKSLIDVIAFPLSLNRLRIEGRLYYTFNITTERTVVLTSLMKMGQVEASIALSKTLKVLDVEAVILTGICGGLSRNLQYGDIVISDQIVNYEMSKIMDNEQCIRWDVFRGDYSIRSGMLNHESQRWTNYLSKVFGDRANIIPRVHSGTVISGNKIIASRDEADRISLFWHNALAVEMEAAGIAALLHSIKKPPSFIMVKSISDFADSNKNDDWQEYAATSAAAFVIDYIFTYPNEL